MCEVARILFLPLLTYLPGPALFLLSYVLQTILCTSVISFRYMGDWLFLCGRIKSRDHPAPNPTLYKSTSMHSATTLEDCLAFLESGKGDGTHL